jgi:cysteine sulfinate desulfinase/cysteine desulfurase-like protein
VGHLRLSLGHSNSDADVTRVLEVLPPLVGRLRELSPFGNTWS